MTILDFSTLLVESESRGDTPWFWRGTWLAGLHFCCKIPPALPCFGCKRCSVFVCMHLERGLLHHE